ncbi:MAG: glycosyltransferase family 1 protein [Armatimonadota bacterium]
MKIAFDFASGAGNVDGIGSYIRGLSTALLETQPDINIVPIFGCLPSSKNEWYPKSEQIKKHPTLFPRRIYNYLINKGMPLEISTGPIDLVHFPNFISYKTSKAKIIVTFHDLAFLEMPHLYPEYALKHYNTLIDNTLQIADFIITNSISTTNSILNFYKWDKTKIMHTYLGGGELNTNKSVSISHLVDEYPYILSIGTHVPRKDYKTLLKAFAKISLSPELRLAIVGNTTEFSKELYQLAEKLNIYDRVIWLGYVCNEEKTTLIKNALCYVHTSLHEGFGIPIVEAMSFSKPIVVSNGGACPEIAGDCAIICKAGDADDFAKGISMILSDKNFANQIGVKAKERAKIFTWKNCANKTREIYDYILSS